MFLLLLIYVLQIFAFVGIQTVGILSGHICYDARTLGFFFRFFERTHQKLYLKQRLAIQALIPTGYMYILLKKNA